MSPYGTLSMMSEQSAHPCGISLVQEILSLLIALQNKEEFLGHLPQINIKQEFHDDYYLCRELRYKLKDSKFSASCAMPPQSSSTSIKSEYYNTRELRDVDVSWPNDTHILVHSHTPHTHTHTVHTITGRGSVRLCGH